MRAGRSMLVRLDDVAERLGRVPHRSQGWMLSWRRYAIIVAVLPEHNDGFANHSEPGTTNND